MRLPALVRDKSGRLVAWTLADKEVPYSDLVKLARDHADLSPDHAD